MKMSFAAAAVAAALAMAPSAAFADRAVNTGLGAGAGLVVFGPVGAVAGALVGFTAGNGISRSWGLGPHRRPPRKARRSAD
jgi:hypothetical protein